MKTVEIVDTLLSFRGVWKTGHNVLENIYENSEKYFVVTSWGLGKM